MRLSRLAVLAAAIPLILAAPATAQVPGVGGLVTTEVLVLTTATEMPRTVNSGRRVAVVIQNLGPNSIYCAGTSATAVVNKAHELLTKGTLTIDAGPYVRIWCIAATANQVTGAATIFTELLEP